MMLSLSDRPSSFRYPAGFRAVGHPRVVRVASVAHGARYSAPDDRRVGEDPPDYPALGVRESGICVAGARLDHALAALVRPSVGGDVAARAAEGIALGLAAELIDGTRVAAADRAANVARPRRATGRAVGHAPEPDIEPDPDAAIARRLKSLARACDRLLAEQVRLLVRFEDEALYLKDGCRSMVVWMGVHLGLAESTAGERLRIGRALRDELPVCEAFFALGKLTLSQLRHVVRCATAETDLEFAHAVTMLSVPATKAYCERFRHGADAAADAANEDEHGRHAAEARAAHRAYERRSLSVRDVDGHTTRIVLELPTAMAADFLGALAHAEDRIREGGEDGHAEADERGPAADARDALGVPADPAGTAVTAVTALGAQPTARQVRADAAVLIGRRSLAHAGEAVATADRYHVHVNVDARELAGMPGAGVLADDTPVERPHMQGHGPISRATARRLAGLAGFTLHAMDDDGQPVGSLRKAPLFTKPQLRAMRARDRQCQVPGCGSTRYLEGHHVVHRADGGGSGIDEGVMGCGGCHALLHEGGFRLERVTVAELEAELADRAGAWGVPGPAPTTRQRRRMVAKLARVRRFRLIGPDGRDCGGPPLAGRVIGGVR